MEADHLEYCLDQVRQGDRDRYLTLLLAPAAARGPLAALAAFNLELARTREQVSEPILGLIRLQWWREAIEEIRAGGKVRRHQVVEGLEAASRAPGLDTTLMLAMIDAREAELESPAPPSLAEFRHHADATAGNLLRLSLQAMRIDPVAAGLAETVSQVGRAYAAVGIARSVLIDARGRRLRLPQEALAAAGVDLDRLFDLKPQPELVACLRGLAMEAERDLAAARRVRPPRAAGPLILTARLAALHLERLRRAAYDPFDPGMIVAHPMDIWRLLWTNLTGRF